ncbi:restriction endonuclease subunit S [Bifidobacterium felsineum]|uniref:restriction endonuclease subunit S n=1 Tax=Bifidobacterium felsineum TaxID=2045440 RepID=UPI001BDD56D1|nr:restriction endonuclease subunit S [Bifidobacterium felsineum]MBT1164465.1 restriction endonuclease subunit S [Bifidobacterium felsineum]
MGKYLLKEVCDITYGFAFDSKRFSSDSTIGLPVIRIRDLKEGTSHTYTDETCDDRYSVHDGDFLIGMDGEFNIVEWQGGDALLNQRVCKIRSSSDDMLSNFLPYVLADELKRIESQTSFVTVKHLSAKVLNRIQFALPSVDRQREIVAILKTLQSEIAISEQMLAKADELIQSRFVEMFGSATNVNLSDICDFYSGGTPSKKKADYWDGTLPWFSPKDMKQPNLSDSTDHINDIVIEQTNLKLLPADTVAVVVRGMILAHDVPIALLMVPATINQDMKALLPKRDCNPVFLAEAVRNQEAFLLSETGSSAHGTKKIDTEVLGAVQIPEVSLSLQNEFAEFVTSVESLKSTTQQQLDRLNTLYASLTQRYFMV